MNALEFEDKTGIKRHAIIEERGKHFAEALSGEDKEIVMSIVNNSRMYLDGIGDKHNVVYSPSKREWATFKVTAKRYVLEDFIKPIISSLNIPSRDFSDIDGMCDNCLVNQIEWTEDEYELCNNCKEKVNLRESAISSAWEGYKGVSNVFYNAFEKTNFPNELIGNFMLLRRKIREDKESKHIDNALKDFIRNKLMNEFANQNKQLLKKYDLWQNQ